MKKSLEPQVALAALDLLALQPWDSLSLEAVAKKAKIPRKTLQKSLPDMTALIPIIVRYFDACAASSMDDVKAYTTAQDYFFDWIMTRLEAMQPHRKSMTILGDLCRRRPDLALALYRALHRSALGTTKHFTQIALLLSVYHMAFQRWSEDESPDLSKTMGFLNSMLRVCGSSMLSPEK